MSSPKVAAPWLQIVGIVGTPETPAVFVLYTLHMWRWTQVLVKTQAPPLTLLHSVRRQVTAVYAEQQSASQIEDLESWIVNGQEWQQQRLAAWIFVAFGLLELALAAVGLYSVVSYTVTQRTNDFGVRMALAAPRGEVLRLVFASTLRSVTTGVAIGLGLTLAMNPVLEQWAKGNSRDPVILVAVALILALASAIASALPAWHVYAMDSRYTP